MNSLRQTDLVYEELKSNEQDELVAYMKRIHKESNSHNVERFSKEEWRWQYLDLPSKESKVFVVKKEGEILGAYHVPIYIGWVFGEKKTLAMIQDVSVSHQLRGQGVFKKLALKAIKEVIEFGVDAFYTFPNQKSGHTFEKYNDFHPVKNMPVYLSPVSTSRIISKKIRLFGLEKLLGIAIDKSLILYTKFRKSQVVIKQYDEITEEIGQVFDYYKKLQNITLERTKEYLTWRFLQKQKTKHFVFCLEREKQIYAVAIFKLDQIFGVPCLVLMDFAATSSNEDILQLILEVRNNTAKYIDEKINLLFTVGNGELFKMLWRIGFFKVPQRLVPRPLILYLFDQQSQPLSDYYDPDNWHITLADWDVF